MKKLLASTLIGCSFAAMVTLAASAVAFSWFNGPNVNINREIIDGMVGLRGYFYDGDGQTPQTAYEIVAPIHYYNLTRLQNLGVFPEKCYFQIGHNFGGEIGMACMNIDEHGEVTYDKYLDMGDLSSQTMILPVGSEATPFVGTFDGNGLVIKNLTVSGYPEDIGVFGYVSYEGSVTRLVCEDLTINSLGYNSNTSSADYQLFSADIEDILSENVSEISRLMSLTYYEGLGSSKVSHPLKHVNGLTGTLLSDVNASSNLIMDESHAYVKGYFEPIYPVRQNEKFTYSWKSSSQLIKAAQIDKDGDGTLEDAIVLDLQTLKESVGTDDCFNNGRDMQADARLSLIASVTIDGFTYSRVIQSYVVEFYSNGHVFDDGEYDAAIYCDYVDNGYVNDRNTNYHHGNNIGLLAGHVDGSFSYSYVYNGTFNFNKTGYTPIYTESDTALIGEIGTNVINDLDPEISLVTNGDIGIMNFSKIYSMIRSDANSDQPHVLACGRAKPAGSDDYKNYVSYDDFKNNATFDNFSEYLRHDDPTSGPVHYITQTATNMANYVNTGYPINQGASVPADFNTVDFIWNKVIQDEEDVDRGLGVFKIVTGNCEEAKTDPRYGPYMLNSLGSSKIVNGDPKTKVYFSTAEYDHIKSDSHDWKEEAPIRGVALPEYSDVNSFDYPFSKDFNYCFELDLADMNKSGGKNYMYNTDSPFLKNYLKSILIDKFGAPVPYNSTKFGFMFRSSENELLTSLSSYMPIGRPGSKAQYSVDGENKYYPSNSIVFRIENEAGANVSVVGNNADIAIYRNNPDSSAGITKLYTMRSSNPGESDIMRYFTYDVETGATATEASVLSEMDADGNCLYGHIFKLPQGDYVLGASNDNQTANVYFLAVQGQNNASIGDKEYTYIGSAVDNVDFLTESPSGEGQVFPYTDSQAMLTFKSTFNSLTGSMSIDVRNVGNKKYISITFLDNPRFVTYLFLYSTHPEHTYFVNNTMYTTTPTLYPRN